jgi:hypothetical protein
LISLTELAADVMAEHGWTTSREADIAKAHLNFDLVAESEAAIVFFDGVRADELRHRAESLAAAVASVTLGQGAGVKAWEAYLVLFVEDDYAGADRAAQLVQRDLDYCRKIILDGAGIAAADDPRSAMEAALSFLFPLDVVLAPTVDDVRQYLIQLMDDRGVDPGLAAELVTAFDSEPTCTCWERVKRFESAKASG